MISPRSHQDPGHTRSSSESEGDHGQLIRCECGYVARGDNDEQIVSTIEAHMGTDHPDLLAQVERADLFGWIQED